MNDKTPLYMVLMVAIVAVVGLIIVMTHGVPSSSSANSNNAASTNTASTGNGLTGNVVADSSTSPVLLNSFGKIFFALFMLGMVVYLYFRVDE